MSLDNDPTIPPDLTDFGQTAEPKAEQQAWLQPTKADQVEKAVDSFNPFEPDSVPKTVAPEIIVNVDGVDYTAPVIPAPPPLFKSPPQIVEQNYSQFGKLAEESLIKIMMLDRDAALIATQSLKPEYFFDPTRRKLFHALSEIARERIEFITDLVTLYEKLNALGYTELTTMDGKVRISEYVDWTPELKTLNKSPNNLLSWCEIIIRSYVRRRLCIIAERSQVHAMSSDKEIEELFDDMDEAVRELKSLGTRVISRAAEIIVEEIMNKVGQPPDVVPTGIACLDKLLRGGGVKRTDYTIIAARPYQGKTTLASQIAANMGDNGKRVLWIPLEMSDEEEVEKLIQYYAQLSYTAVQENHYDPDAPKRLKQAQVRVAGMDLHVTNKGIMTIPMIWREVAMLHSTKPLDAIFIDQLTLISEHKRHNDERAKLEYFSRNLKLLTQELKIPVFLMHQISREGEKESEKGERLSMRHLRSAGGIEQDADNVILIQPPDTDNEFKAEGEMTLAKQRKGRAGIWQYVYHKDYGVFDDKPNSQKIGLPKKQKTAGQEVDNFS